MASPPLFCLMQSFEYLTSTVIKLTVIVAEPVLDSRTLARLNPTALVGMHVPSGQVLRTNDLSPMSGDSIKGASRDLNYEASSVPIELERQEINAALTGATKVRQGTCEARGAQSWHDTGLQRSIHFRAQR
jgi:hypothetical protein